MRGKLVTLGEAMGVVAATEPGPLAPGAAMRMDFAGAEATVAIGVSRLGHESAWVGSVGADAVGTMVLDRLRAERVDVSRCRIDPELPSGLMIRERRTADRIRVTYYRAGLAGSRLSVGEVDPEQIAEASVLHLTGITPALSATARDAVHAALDAAVDAGVTVSLDLNYRSALWPRAAAAAELAKLVSRSDIVFAGPDEAALLVPTASPAAMAESLAALGPSQVVLKLGAEGALALYRGRMLRQPALPVTMVDPVGAGDAFVAGYLAGVLDGGSVRHRLRQAATCGAFAVSVPGDWAGLPFRHELELLAGTDIQR
ncbi:2-dehydro-3-deoxygluconokinase [Nocardia tenerifensis]|uniref:2-dehydro-3-deoxygluconokinase n=1 Tax=Nocardia tenerifensis TaxID=228006 RepID=A0A318JLW2_9NOCA|nr:sugar kinase [Nocardia tenerifensis]PXX54732.1 2-dehydro-3-deoxygluconokinase [Nocardia tenerifensis]